MSGLCGSCTACCRVYAIPALDKRAGDWCTHCDVGVGCRIYADRPPACHDFKCLWLQSQERENPAERLAPELRPDRCKVVLCPSTNPSIMGATTMPGAPDAWRRGAVHAFLKRMVERGLTVAIHTSNSLTSTKWTRDGMRAVQMTPPDKDGMQWSVNADDYPSH